MDQETREAFDALMGLTTQNKENTDKCLRLLEHHGEKIERLEEDNVALKAEVFTSKPPPPSSAVAPPGVHLNGGVAPSKISKHGDEIMSLAGQIETLRDEMATKKEVDAIKTDVTTIKDINVAQNNTYGISKKEAPTWKKVAKFLGSRDGRSFLVSILIVVLTALGYKTATDTKQATADVEKSIQRAEENVVRTTLSAAPHAPALPPTAPAASTPSPPPVNRATP